MTDPNHGRLTVIWHALLDRGYDTLAAAGGRLERSPRELQLPIYSCRADIERAAFDRGVELQGAAPAAT